MKDGLRKRTKLVMPGVVCLSMVALGCARGVQKEHISADVYYEWNGLKLPRDKSLKIGIPKDSDVMTITENATSDVLLIDSINTSIPEKISSEKIVERFRADMIKQHNLGNNAELISISKSNPTIQLIEIQETSKVLKYEGILILDRTLFSFRSIRSVDSAKKNRKLCKVWSYLSSLSLAKNSVNKKV